MANEPLVLEHSLEADVSFAFAWTFRTDIATWNDPPATFLLDGPFAEGSRGTTLMPGQDPWPWWVRDVQAGRAFAIEMPLDRAMLRFEWQFRAVSVRRTELTQRIILSGTNAAAVRNGIRHEPRAGMERIAAAMVAAEQGRDQMPANRQKGAAAPDGRCERAFRVRSSFLQQLTTAENGVGRALTTSSAGLRNRGPSVPCFRCRRTRLK